MFSKQKVVEELRHCYRCFVINFIVLLDTDHVLNSSKVEQKARQL